MPELPEVESLTRKISPLLQNNRIVGVEFFRDTLREPIDTAGFRRHFLNKTIKRVWRRSKYMLWETSNHAALFHFGMSGIMVLQASEKPVLKHTHVVFIIGGSGEKRQYLHFVDPRRFGLMVCCQRDELTGHRLLTHLGVEPLDTARLGVHLYNVSRDKTCSIKTLLMDAHMIVGIGNIYASESLFLAGVSPLTPAGRLTMAQCRSLAAHCKKLLIRAIAAGGTSFRDFIHPDHNPGYFALNLKVYQREGQSCSRCGGSITRIVQQQRSTFYCHSCQPMV